MLKRISALLLALSLSLSVISPALASEITDFSDEALRISDEFTAQYPGGAFSLSSVSMEVQEHSGRSVLNVVRQGGAAGNVEVTVKAIDISAKIGQDYRLSIPGLIFDKEIEGNETADVILQSGETQIVTGAALAVTETSGTTTESGITAGPGTVTEEIEILPAKSTGLKAAKEMVTSQTLDREKLASPYSEEDQLTSAVTAANDFYDGAPGTVFTLSFKDGERRKSFNLDIINDDASEAEEQVVFVITAVTEGGFLGMQKETTVNIIDDEPYEQPVISFAAAAFTADKGKAVITLNRTAGINYYAGAFITSISDSALPGQDYTEIGQKILFIPGQKEMSIEIPVSENTSSSDKYFYIKIEPDNSIAVSGEEVAQVRIPVRRNDVEKSAMLIAGSSLQTVSEDGIMLGIPSVKKDALHGMARAEGSDNGHWDHESGWYEGIFKSKNKDARYYTKDSFFMSYLDSVYVNFMLYDLGGFSSYFRAWMDAGFQGTDGVNRITRNIFSAMTNYRNKNKMQRVQFMGRNYASSGDIPSYFGNWNSMPRQTTLQTPFIRAVNDKHGDEFAARIYSFEYYFREFQFDIYQAFADEYTIDFSDPAKNYSVESVTPGTFKITTPDGQLAKGIYTSEAHSIYMSATNVRSGWYLKGVNFYDRDDMNHPKFFPLDSTGVFTFDNNWLYDYADKYGKAGKFIIQPVFDRKEATLTVSMPQTDKDKGVIAGLINSTTPSVTLKEIVLKEAGQKDQTYRLREADKVVLKGTGKDSYMVNGYNVSYNNGIPNSEAGSQNAGVYTLRLMETVNVSPIFGAQLLNLKRDPDNKKQYPGIQGVITYAGQSTGSDGELGGIHSGQYIEFASIPPEGYTTLWANRTGDTNGNGVLDNNEIRDSKGKLYRQFDYDGDGQLDAEYDTPMFGDLFGYKIVQPNPLFYYYYEPMTGKTKYSGAVSGAVVTREYSIRKGYTKVKNENDEDVDKLVPVVGAAVKMGGSYDSENRDAQLGYGTSTDDQGLFEFMVSNVIKNTNYLLTVDFNGVSYVDKINPSSSKQLILPTFTSMKPISINAVPRSGQDSHVVDGSVVMLQDKTVDFNLLTASLENNVKVKNAIFRIFTPDGTLVPNPLTADAPNVNDKGIFKVAVDDQGKAVFTENLNKYFVPNAKLTVQLEDQNGNRSMEYNSGFQFRPKILDTSILPSFAAPYVKSIPLVESVMGKLDLGLATFADLKANDEGYTIYLGAGHQFDEKSKVLKDTMDKAEKGTDAEKKAAKNELKKENKSAPEKAGSNVKVKSTITNNLGVKVSLQMNIKYDEKAPKGVESPYYFGSLMLMVTLEDSLEYETRIALPVGVSFIIKLGIGGSVTGYVYISQHTSPLQKDPIKVYADKYGSFPYTEGKVGSVDQKFDYEGGIILEPIISIAAGPSYGVADVAVWGTAKFDLTFSTAREGSGKVTLKAGVTATVLGFEVYSKNFGNWEYDLFGNPASLMAQMYGGSMLDESTFEPISREYLSNRGSWTGDQPLLMASGTAGSDYTERTLMQGIYPEPDTQLMRIDEDSLLMVFIDDHMERSAQNRGAVYYSISHDNGSTFSQPVLLDNDSTLDSHPRLTDLGSRILLVYSSLDKVIPEGMSMEDVLESHDLEMAFFDKATCEFTTPVQVTKNTEGDYHSDMDASAVYDAETGQVLIIYQKTDYTSDPDEDFTASDVFNSYSTITYTIYDTNTNSFLPYSESDYPQGMTAEQKAQWDADWYGQRFLDTSITDAGMLGGGISDPLVFDLTAQIKDRTAYFAYTADMDGNLETLEDRDIYLQKYSFANATFTEPMKISDLQSGVGAKSDGKPQLVNYINEMYLFFHADTAIHYYNLDDYDPTVPGVALEYSAENLPTDDYQILKGDDGKLYLLWTEETVRLADGVEPGSQESLLAENIYHEDQIFASMFYEDLDATIDNSYSSGHYGKWSGKVQITEGPGSYDDVDAYVMADSKIILTAKKSEKILVDDSQTSPRMDNPNNAGLVVLTLTPVMQPELTSDAITFESDYPLPNKVTTIMAEVNNHGLMPLLDPTVDFYMVQGGVETYIGTGENTSPVYGGCKSVIATQWTVPADMENIKITAKLRSGADESVISQAEKMVPFGTKLEYSLFDIDYVAQNLYRAYIEVHHTGNMILDNAQLVIRAADQDRILHELKRVNIDNSTDALEMFVIDEGFQIPPEYLSEGSTEVEVRIESNGSLLTKQTALAKKNLSNFYKNLISETSGIELASTDITLSRGMTGKITASVYPAEAGEKNNVVFRSSNPAIASVNDLGEITALNNGSTIITAYSVPRVDATIQTGDGHSIKDDILDQLSLDDVKSDSMTVTVRMDSTSGIATIKTDPAGKVALTATPSVNTDTGIATVTLSRETLATAFSSVTAGEDGKKTVLLDILKANGARAYDTDLPASFLTSGDQSRAIQIKTDFAEVTVPGNMLSENITRPQNTSLAISLGDATGLPDEVQKQIGSKPLIQLNIKVDGKTISWSNKNAPVTVAIPYTPTAEEMIDPEHITAWYIDSEGNIVSVPSGRYDPSSGKVTFHTTHFSQYAIAFVQKTFSDIKTYEWAKDEIEVLASKGIISGTSASRFNPSAKITRADFLTLLIKTVGLTAEIDSSFEDVKSDDYYYEAVGIAKKLGISSGIGNNLFNPGAPITRQDMMVMAAKAMKIAGKLSTTGSLDGLSGFVDMADISPYAAEAVAAMVKEGLIAGSSGRRINPDQNATRAETAVLMYKIYNK